MVAKSAAPHGATHGAKTNTAKAQSVSPKTAHTGKDAAAAQPAQPRHHKQKPGDAQDQVMAEIRKYTNEYFRAQDLSIAGAVLAAAVVVMGLVLRATADATLRTILMVVVLVAAFGALGCMATELALAGGVRAQAGEGSVFDVNIAARVNDFLEPHRKLVYSSLVLMAVGVLSGIVVSAVGEGGMVAAALTDVLVMGAGASQAVLAVRLQRLPQPRWPTPTQHPRAP